MHARLGHSERYFLVPGEKPGQAWRAVSAAEANRVRGMSRTGATDPRATTQQDDMAKPLVCKKGMRLQLHRSGGKPELERPTGRPRPAHRPPAYVQLTYNQRAEFYLSAPGIPSSDPPASPPRASALATTTFTTIVTHSIGRLRGRGRQLQHGPHRALDLSFRQSEGDRQHRRPDHYVHLQ
jgi:hypothetical protein